MTQEPSLTDTLRRIQSLSAECDNIVQEMDITLRKIEYLALALSFRAEDQKINPETLKNLKDDARYAASLRYEDLGELNDKILEFFVDFLTFVNTNEEIQLLFSQRESGKSKMEETNNEN